MYAKLSEKLEKNDHEAVKAALLMMGVVTHPNHIFFMSRQAIVFGLAGLEQNTVGLRARCVKTLPPDGLILID